MNRKADGINRPLELHKHNLQKNSNGNYFPIGSCCQPWLTKPFFYWLHEMAACCYFGADLGNGLDYYPLSRLTDGTLHSSSDFLFFTLLLLFYWDKLFQVQLPYSLLLLWTKFSKSNSSSLFSSDKNFLSLTSILQKHSTAIPKPVLAAKSFQSRKKILSSIFYLTWKSSLLVLNHFILLSPETKRCPLTLASALACADSVDELRF